ncbi:DUF2530 domain-containing protein [Cellulomonas sp.]|uniref:DUF2530 domain-containing protein n=1 Tax=Cellulomonas sp. TaxID=40001 RepID=UPI0028126AD9|nr:DUF2530 domain-containing protein [Cellulomonas sp.]
MRSLLDVLLHPQRTPPPPLDVDLGRVMAAGTGAWVIALLVTTGLWRVGVATTDAVLVCAAGALVGVAGVEWARRHGRLAADGSGATLGPDADRA